MTRGATLGLLAAPTGAADPSGRADRVVDGDTLEVAGARVRLWGVDAPELGQECLSALGVRYRCGVAAREALKAIVGGWDVGKTMVRAGLAVDYRRYSRGRYADDQRWAEGNRTGMWEGSFEMPWDWRREKR